MMTRDHRLSAGKTTKLSAARRGDALMRCFVLTAWDDSDGRAATSVQSISQELPK